ncbi:MAG: hypothetical protein KME45_20230 [Stenomitos rutilans HA7619-LM2]|jgi:hypothetical protein|nr:hypothetical protein [Stenomitos rutilans HA7619-LM2]
MRLNDRWLQRLIGLGLVWLLVVPVDAAERSPDRSSPHPSLLTPHPSPYTRLARKFTCPTALEPLTTALLRDLPGYINRSNVRLGAQQGTVPTYAILASQPDFMPLPTGSSEYPDPNDANLHQVFFTVLERQYLGKRVVEFQQYHWLFLAQTANGWRLALLFSRIGSYPSDRKPVTPPRDSSQGSTAEAIRTWLSSCESEAVKP